MRPFLQVLALGLLLCCSTGCYLTHLAFGQLDVSFSTVDVEEALADPALDETSKEKIRFVGEVKRFTQQRIGMKPSDNYTTYFPGDPDSPLSYVVTASEKLRFELVTHWYPFVGTVTYKGFFDLGLAREEKADLQEEGYDVFLRPVAAYSTLGWFIDPITPMMLKRGEPDLAELIIHELTHSEIYARGHTDFNESLATFVGHEGALQFAAEQWGPESKPLRTLRDARADSAMFDAFIRDVKGRLLRIYASRTLSDRQKLAAREKVFRAAADELRALQPKFRVSNYGGFAGRPMNNAVILAYLSYNETDLFEALFEKVGRSWPEFFADVRRAAEARDPFRALQETLQED